MEYTFKVNEGLKSHQIKVDKKAGIVLKGKQIGVVKADKLIRKKAKWIIEKPETVYAVSEGNLATGSQDSVSWEVL